LRDKENVPIQHNKVRYLSVSSLSISHTFKTTYTYNSYNQLISTTNPDQEGETRFWYDFYGRIVASQNPNQAEVNTFSYTLYDEIGRPVEVGQIQASTFPSENTLKLNDKGSAFKAWVVANEPRTEVTRTRYDQSLDQTIDAKFATGKQENLRMRVASVMHYSIIDNTPMERFDWSLYQSAIHYLYDWS
jgi:YD repeat-containing protein